MTAEKKETVEESLDRWAAQMPGLVVTQAERGFIEMMREYALRGVGYGWMMQVIETEWNTKVPGAWGPEYYLKQVLALEAENKALKTELETLRKGR